MKSISVILVILFASSTVFAQSWKDSLRKGSEHYKNENYQQAYASFLEAQKLAPEEVDLSQDIGNAAYRTNDFKTAEKAFLSAADKNEDDIQQGEQWHNVGNAQMKEKNYKAAVESYKNALRKNPNDEKTRYNLAEAKRRLKQQESQKNNSQDKQESQESEERGQGESQQDSNSGDQGENQENDKAPQDNTSQESGEGDSPTDAEGRLSDRKTDRMLDDLLKQEMETKRKMQGKQSGDKKNAVKSGKRW